MSWYNHFSEQKYISVKFSNLSIGDMFRKDFWNKKKRRKDILCVKTGEVEYMEQKSKRKYILASSDIMVSSINVLLK